MHTTLVSRKEAVPAGLGHPQWRFRFMMAIVVGVLGLEAPVAWAAGSSHKVAVVLEPKVTGPIIPQDRDVIDKAVSTALVEQQFQLAGKDERDSIVTAGNMKNCYRNDCLEQLGRLLGVSIVVAYRIHVEIAELPPSAAAAAESRRGRRSAENAASATESASPLRWQVTAALYNIEVGAIGARLEIKCEHCSGPQVAQNVADMIKRAVLEDASKPREVLEISSEPSNSSVLVDGVELGVTPYKRLTFVGKHEITIRHTGYKSVNQQIDVVESHKTILSYPLELGRDTPRYIHEYQPRPKWRLGVGGGLIGLGLAGIGVGAYGLAINGKCVDEPPIGMACDTVRRGLPAGLGFMIGGAVAAVAGAVMIIIPGKRNPLLPENEADTFTDKANEKIAPPQAALSFGSLGSGVGMQLMGNF